VVQWAKWVSIRLLPHQKTISKHNRHAKQIGRHYRRRKRFGREIDLGLAAKGSKVFSTAFSPSEVSGLASAAPAGDVTLTICDITKEEDVKNWACVGQNLTPIPEYVQAKAFT
jgi:hypothetical protein